MRSAKSRRVIHNDRGVALLITLLVTSLLMALVFEFAYATRVSLRAAVNFRDSQRAYFLARSGVNFAGKLLSEYLKQNKPQEQLEQREWQVVPIVSAGDMELRVRWEDEAGKISISNLAAGQASLSRLDNLCRITQVSVEVVDRLKELKQVSLLGDLHKIMSDEEFGKIHGFVTIFSGTDNVNVNTAPAEVIQSLGVSEPQTSMIIEQRGEPYSEKSRIPGYSGIDPTISGKLVLTSDIFRIHSHATVGGYTKQAEAVIQRTPGSFLILYWRIL